MAPICYLCTRPLPIFFRPRCICTGFTHSDRNLLPVLRLIISFPRTGTHARPNCLLLLLSDQCRWTSRNLPLANTLPPGLSLRSPQFTVARCPYVLTKSIQYPLDLDRSRNRRVILSNPQQFHWFRFEPWLLLKVFDQSPEWLTYREK